MTLVLVAVLLALAALSLGFRTTSVLIPGANPLVCLVAAVVIGTVFVLATLRICDRYGVHDLGLGLLVSLSPVGVYDFVKWRFRFRGAAGARTSRQTGEGYGQASPPKP